MCDTSCRTPSKAGGHIGARHVQKGEREELVAVSKGKSNLMCSEVVSQFVLFPALPPRKVGQVK